MVIIYVLLAGFVALPPLSTDPMDPSPILLNFCWWCYHLCSTVFCQAWAMTTYIWNLCKEEVFVEYPYPPPQPYWVFSKEWVWPGTLCFNELCSRLRIIAIASCSASWTHRGCFPAAPIVDCLWVSSALSSEVYQLSLTSRLCDGRKQYRICFSYYTKPFDAASENLSNLKASTM